MTNTLFGWAVIVSIGTHMAGFAAAAVFAFGHGSTTPPPIPIPIEVVKIPAEKPAPLPPPKPERARSTRNVYSVMSPRRPPHSLRVLHAPR